MPTFENVEVTTTADIDFEVFCGTCGAGLCNVSDTRRSSRRGYLQVTVSLCPDCKNNYEEEISILKSEIADLENQLSKYE